MWLSTRSRCCIVSKKYIFPVKAWISKHPQTKNLPCSTLIRIPNATVFNGYTKKESHGQPDRQRRSRSHDLERDYSRRTPSRDFRSELYSASKEGNMELLISIIKSMKQEGISMENLVANCIIVCLANAGLLNQALEKLKELEGRDIEVRPPTIHAILAAYGRSGRWEAMLQHFRELPFSSKDLISYNVIIHQLGENDKLDKMMEMFEECKQARLEPNIFTYNSLLHHVGRVGNLGQIKALVHEMKSIGISYNNVTFTNLVNAYSRHKPSELKAVYREMLAYGITPSNSIYHMLLKHMETIDETLDVFQEMLYSGVEMEADHMNLVMSKLFNAKKYEEILQVFEVMKKQLVAPDDRTVSIVMRCLGNLSRWSQLHSLFEELKKDSIVLSVETYHTLLSVLASHDQVGELKAVLDEMKANGLQASVETFTVLVKNLNKLEDMAEVLAHAQEEVVMDQSIFMTLIHKLIDLHMLDKVEEAMVLTKKYGIPVDLAMYNAVVGHLADKGHLQKMEELVKAMEQAGFQKDTLTYNSLIQGYGRYNKLEKMMKAFEEMKESDIKRDVTTYNTLFKFLQEYDTVSQLFDQMQEEGISPNNVTIELIVAAGSKENKLNEPDIRKFVSIPSVSKDAKVYNGILVHLAWSGMIDQMKLQLDEVNELGVSVDAKTYNIMVHACTKYGDMKGAIKIFGKMQQAGHTATSATVISMLNGIEDLEESMDVLLQMMDKGYHLDDIACNIMLHKFASNNRLDQMRQMYKLMRKYKVVPTRRVFKTLLVPFSKAQLWQDVDVLIKDMKTFNIEKDITIYNTLMTAYNKKGDAQAVLATYRELQQANIKLNIYVLNTIINYLGATGNFDELLSIFNQLHTLGVEPNVVTYNIMFRRLGEGKMFEEILKVRADMKARGMFPDVFGYSFLLIHLGRSEFMEKFDEIYVEAIGRGIFVSQATYAHIITSYASKGMREKALKVIDDMKAAGVLPGMDVYTVAIIATDNRADATRIFRQMQMDGVEPSIKTYNCLINKMADSPEDMMKIYAAMKDAKISPDIITYSTLMQHLSAKQGLAFMEDVYRDMKKANILPNAHIVNYLLETYGKAGKIDEMYKIFDEWEGRDILTSVNHNTMLNYLGINKRLSEMMNFLKTKRKQEFQPDRSTYITLVSRASGHKNLEMLQEILDMMNETNFRFDTETYNHLLARLNVTGPADLVCTFYENAAKWNVPIREAIANALPQWLCRGRRLDLLKRFEQEVETEKIKLHTKTYNQIFYELSPNGNMELVMKWVQHMVNNGVQPDVHTFGPVLKELTIRDRDEERNFVLSIMKKYNVPLNLNSSKAIATMHGKEGNWKEFLNLYGQIRRAMDLEMVMHAVNCFLKALLDADRIPQMMEAVAWMQQENLRPDAFTFYFLFAKLASKSYEAELKVIVNLLKKRKDLGQRVFEWTINHLIKNNFNDIAVELYEAIKPFNFEFDKFTYGSLIGCTAKAGQLDKLLLIVRDMKSANAQPNFIVYENLMELLIKENRQDIIRAVQEIDPYFGSFVRKESRNAGSS